MIVRAVEAGIPTPVFSAPGLRWAALQRPPTALTQSQRDLFAPTYGLRRQARRDLYFQAEEGKPEIEA